MRIIIADCEVNYSGRLDAHLPRAMRLIMVKADGSVLIHSDGGSYKPLNWMSAPCQLQIEPQDKTISRGVEVVVSPQDNSGISSGESGLEIKKPVETWTVSTKKNEALVIEIYEIREDVQCDLGVDPGLVKDGVEAHLQKLLAEQVPQVLGKGWTLVRREWPTPIGPVDLLVHDADNRPVAVEVKRRGEIDGVEQLTRYLELLGRQTELQGITGIFAAQEIKPQARTLAEDRGIRCVILDYDEMRGIDADPNRLF